MSFVTIPNSRDNVHVDRSTHNVGIGVNTENGAITQTLTISGDNNIGSIGLLGVSDYSITSKSDSKLMVRDETDNADRLFINTDGHLFTLFDQHHHGNLKIGSTSLGTSVINYNLEISSATPNVGLVDSDGTTSVITCNGNELLLSNNGNTGITMLNSGNVWINKELNIGSSSATTGLYITHDGTNATINNTQNGQLNLSANGGSAEIVLTSGLSKIPNLQLNDTNTVTNITVDTNLANLGSNAGTLVTETVIKEIYDRLTTLENTYNTHTHPENGDGGGTTSAPNQTV